MLTETWLDGRRLTYGHPLAVLPRLLSTDNEAEELGFYVEGTWAAHPDFGRGASLISKQLDNWRSIWSSSPLLPSAWLQKFAQEAGVFIYSDCGNIVYRIGNLLGVTARIDGMAALNIPKLSDVIDYHTGETIARDCTRFSVELKRGETKIFKVE